MLDVYHGTSRPPWPTPRAILGRFRDTPLRLYALAVLPAALVVTLIACQPLVPVEDLVRDPMAVAEKHGDGRCWYGVVSNIGVVLWCLAAGAGFLGSLAAPRRRPFLAIAAGLTLFLMTDDLFMLHETVFPGILGLNEKILFLGYGLTLAVWLLAWRDAILDADPGLLALALLLFALSLGQDAGLDGSGAGSWHWLGEDGAKLLGINAWAVFLGRAAWRAIIRERGPVDAVR